ncbi:794_t:CDS:2, partial [Gigaspora margarita]
GISEINEALRDDMIKNILKIYMPSLSIVSRSHGKGPIDWVIKMNNTIISVTKAKKENINQDIAQSTAQAHHSYEEANMYKDVTYGIVTTDRAHDTILLGVEAELVNNENDNENGDVQVYWSSKSPVALPINK